MIDTTKTHLQNILKEAKDNITQHKSTHSAALEQLKAQEAANKEFDSVLSGYNQQFKDLGQRQRNIENQLSLQNSPILAMKTSLSAIMEYFQSNGHILPQKPTPTVQDINNITPQKMNTPTSAAADGGKSL